MNNTLEKIKGKLLFTASFTPYDFTENMKQYALEVNYTNGDKDMYTTPMPKDIGSDQGDFKDFNEFNEACNFLTQNNIPRGDRK